jgi:hypothetical protein
VHGRLDFPAAFTIELERFHATVSSRTLSIADAAETQEDQQAHPIKIIECAVVLLRPTPKARTKYTKALSTADALVVLITEASLASSHQPRSRSIHHLPIMASPPNHSADAMSTRAK